MALTEKLTAIADAIRGKTGKTEEMTLDQMVTEIEGIEAGGGGDDNILLSILDRSVTEFINDEIETLGPYAFYLCKALTRAKLSNLITLKEFGFNSCSSLKDVYLPKVQTVGGNSFSGTGVETIDLPSCVSLGSRTFRYVASLKSINVPSLTVVNADDFASTGLETIVLPSCTEIYNNAFGNCTSLTSADFHVPVNLRTNVFASCSSFDTLILRGNKVSSCGNINNFGNTPFSEGGTGGTVYVPQALIEQYQQATNWSTLYAAGTCNFVAIEGSEYE